MGCILYHITLVGRLILGTCQCCKWAWRTPTPIWKGKEAASENHARTRAGEKGTNIISRERTQWQSAYLACLKPWVWFPAPQKQVFIEQHNSYYYSSIHRKNILSIAYTIKIILYKFLASVNWNLNFISLNSYLFRRT